MFLTVGFVARAQKEPEQDTVQVRDGGTTEVLQSIFIPPMPRAPFQLTLATEWTRPLGTAAPTPW
jgi:hypothetical protein